MIDSHCHLDHEPLMSEISNVLERSKSVGISKLLTICTSHNSFHRILNLIEKDPIIYGTFGIHPHETEKDSSHKKDIVLNVNKNKKIIGIGETGLDFFYNNSHKDKQIFSFREHIEASIDLKIPIIIHSRNAEEETLKILQSYKNDKIKILMHCFTGSLIFAKELIKLNSYFSASGIITFKNSLDLQQTFKEIPIDKLLIETDSPFLAPIPMRGKKNEPSFIKYTAEKLAELKKCSFKDIDAITTKNFDKLFF
jgi:TatD DNase family protein